MRVLKKIGFAAMLLFGAIALEAAHARKPYKVGLMLPATGNYAALGKAIENGFKLYIDQQGGSVAGRTIQYVLLDDESSPAKAVDNVNRLIRRDNVDALVGTVHSGVAMAMVRAAKASNTLLIIPNAGAAAFTRSLCAPNVFRTSFSNWQPAYAMGVVAAKRGDQTAVTISWKYVSGEESASAFKEGFEAHGGKVVEQMFLPFPSVQFQPLITQIAASKPHAVYAFLSGPAAVKFVKEYEEAGLKQRVNLYSPGFLTEGTLQAQGQSAEGLYSVMHYADDLNTPRDNAFRAAYEATYGEVPDVYAVQGYDAAQLLVQGLRAVNGDTSDTARFYRALGAAKIDSPRGPFTLSGAHNPIQDMYLRQVRNGKNIVLDVAVKALADPAHGCRSKY